MKKYLITTKITKVITTTVIASNADEAKKMVRNNKGECIEINEEIKIDSKELEESQNTELKQRITKLIKRSHWILKKHFKTKK